VTDTGPSTQTDDKPKTEKQVAIEKSSMTIEMAIRECGVMAVREQPPFMQAIRMAYGIKTIKEALPDQFIRDNFMPLQNSALGFLTDAKEGYAIDVVRDVLCEALLRGFMPVGNEFNIIAGRFYGAKNGFERIVREFPGMRDLWFELGVPHMAGDKGALVPVVARWHFEGVADELLCVDKTKDGGIDARIPVRVNSGMGADGILGKATRKMYARIYQRLTGCASDVVDQDPDAIPTTALPAPAEPAKDGKRIKLNGDKKNGEAAPEPAASPPQTEAEKLAAEAAADEKQHATK
jgi:hypothetical protein